MILRPLATSFLMRKIASLKSSPPGTGVPVLGHSWGGGIAMALAVSPWTWIGSVSSVCVALKSVSSWPRELLSRPLSWFGASPEPLQPGQHVLGVHPGHDRQAEGGGQGRLAACGGRPTGTCRLWISAMHAIASSGCETQ